MDGLAGPRGDGQAPEVRKHSSTVLLPELFSYLIDGSLGHRMWAALKKHIVLASGRHYDTWVRQWHDGKQ